MRVPTKRVHTCAYCGPGITHIIDPIDYPNDWLAKPDSSGLWKCGNCFEREIQDKIVKITPNSQRAKEIIVERKVKEKKELELNRQW